MQFHNRIKIVHDTKCDQCNKMKSTLCVIPVDKYTILDNICGKCIRLLIKVSIHEKKREKFLKEYRSQHSSDSEDEDYLPENTRCSYKTIHNWDIPWYDIDLLKSIHQKIKDRETEKRRSRRIFLKKKIK